MIGGGEIVFDWLEFVFVEELGFGVWDLSDEDDDDDNGEDEREERGLVVVEKREWVWCIWRREKGEERERRWREKVRVWDELGVLR